jgi:hypothetical protein
MMVMPDLRYLGKPQAEGLPACRPRWVPAQAYDVPPSCPAPPVQDTTRTMFMRYRWYLG